MENQVEERMPLDRSALFADQTPQFLYPYEMEAGDIVTFRFRTLKDNVDAVTLFGRGLRHDMYKRQPQGRFDYYEAKVRLREEPFSYYFEIIRGEERCIFDASGVTSGTRRLEENYFRVYPGFKTPDWAKGAVIYQIFTDRFYNGDPGNDVLDREYYYNNDYVRRIEDWNALPEKLDVGRFYGGDLVGVRKKLGYLKHLGVEVIYLNPIFVSPSNHKYDIQDYDYVDPHLVGFVNDAGDVLPEGVKDNTASTRYMNQVTDKRNLEHANAYFESLVKEAHSMGIRVILDGVFNHCGSFNKWMDGEKIYKDKEGHAPGAYVSEDSPYHDYFLFEEGSVWPDNSHYLGWWDFASLPKLNYEDSSALHDYVMRIAEKWISPPYNVDGWRLDVAADLGRSSEYNHKFWRDFRKAVKTAKTDALILAEHYGSPNHWLRGDQWDSVMNYDAFMEPVSYFLTGMEKHSDEYDADLHGNGYEFFRTMKQTMRKLPVQSLFVAMNELSNHDHSRFMTRTNSTPGRLATNGPEAAGRGIHPAVYKEGVVMQFTLPGAPTIYYGDETGVVGFTDPDSRRTYPWGHEDHNLIAFHRDMIAIHKKYDCFKTGSFMPLSWDSGTISYGRFDDRHFAVVVVNNTSGSRYMEIPVWKMGTSDELTAERVMRTYDWGYNVGRVKVHITEGVLTVEVPAFTADVYIGQLY